MLVSSLVQLEQGESKELERLQERLDTFEQDKAYEVGLKEEAIRKLIHLFVPEDCKDLVS